MTQYDCIENVWYAMTREHRVSLLEMDDVMMGEYWISEFSLSKIKYPVEVPVPQPYPVHLVKHIAQPYPVYIEKKTIIAKEHVHHAHPHDHGYSLW